MNLPTQTQYEIRSLKLILAGKGNYKTNVFASNSDTRRGTNVGGNIFDSNGAITPAGSKTMTQTVSGSGNGGVVMASFAPSVSPTFIPRIIIF